MTIGLVLSLIFMTLKLIGVLEWSWLIVFLPCLIEFGIELIGTIVCLIFGIEIFKS
jgi:hypothetical protein